MSPRRPFARVSRLLLLPLALVLAQEAEAQSTRTLTGVVQDSLTGEKLSATLLVLPGGIATRTNADGRFTVLGAPVSALRLEVRALGHLPREIAIPAGTMTTVLTIRLASASHVLGEVRVEGENDRAVDLSAGPGVVSVSTRQIQTMPAVGEADIFRSLQMLPGVSSASDGSSGLYVRGGTPDQNLVLLDGMTVYHVDHLLGVFSAFNADAIKDVQLYQGAFPAKYGGRVSSVVALTGRSGDEHTFRASGGVSLMSARGVVEIPLGRGSILLSGRRSYSDLIRTPLYERLFGLAERASGTSGGDGPGGGFPGGGRPGGGFGFGGNRENTTPASNFHDLNGKLSYRPSDRDVLTLSLYAGNDHLDQSRMAPAGGPQGDSSRVLSFGDVSDWGNRGVSARWFRQWGARFSSDLLAAWTRYQSRGEQGSAGGGGTVGGVAQSFATQEENRVDDRSLRLDNEWRLTPALALDFGAWLTANDVAFSSVRVVNDTGTTGLDRRTRGALNAGYVQARWTPLASLDVTGGMRYATYDLTDARHAEPRAAVSFRLTPTLTFRAAWGIHHQYVNRIENEDVLRGSRDFWVLADSALPPTRARHALLGAVLTRGGWEFSVEGYDKALTDVSLYSRRLRRVTVPGSSVVEGDASLFWTGDGSAQGVELMAQRTRGRLTGWMSYRWGRTQYQFAGVNAGEAFAANHDRTHEAKVVASYIAGPWTLSANWVGSTGTPYSAPESQYTLTMLDGGTASYVHVGDKNGYRLPAYHRLDLAAFRTFTGNSRFDWDLGLSLFNAYGRQNTWYRQFDLSTTPLTVTDVSMLGFTPSIDVRFRLK